MMAETDQNSSLRVFVDSPKYYVRPTNTDWRYMQNLKNLSSFGGPEVFYDRSPIRVFSKSAKYMLGRFGFPTDKLAHSVQSSQLEELGVSAILNNDTPPLVRGQNIPVIWRYGMTDPEMLRSSGIEQQVWERTKRKFSKYSSQVSIVINASEAGAARNSEMFPNFPGKFMAVPYFLENISAISEAEVVRKQLEADPVRFIFVGGEGQRKGLDLVLEAWSKLPEAVASSASLTVVSREMKPEWVGRRSFEYLSTLSQSEVIARMRSSHVFIMPSRRESFGFVYLEAMAAGCSIIAAPWESQREILDNGAAGMNCQPNLESVVEAMLLMIDDGALRLRYATAGRARYLSKYSPEASAKAYKSAVLSCI